MKHTHEPNFGRKVTGCPRCEELKNGAQPVMGWGQHKRAMEQEQINSIRKHNCKESNCGPVCTFGDW